MTMSYIEKKEASHFFKIFFLNVVIFEVEEQAKRSDL